MTGSISRSRFPTTRGSAIARLGAADPTEKRAALAAIARAYWRPIYAHARLRWGRSPAEAEDVTQAFLLRAVSHDTFGAFDPSAARFRTFVRICLDRFITDQARHDQAQKRGGGMAALSVDADFAAAERALAELTVVDDPAAAFDTEWRSALVATVIDRLRHELTAKGKREHLRAFELAHLEPSAGEPSREEIARTLGISVVDVANRLSYARRAFRRIALETLRELTGSADELRDEARAVFGL